MKRVTIGSLLEKGTNAWKKKKYEESARFFHSVNAEKPYFYSQYMETIAHYMAGNLAAFKRKYTELLHVYEGNPYLAELQAFIALKSEPLDKALEIWVALLDLHPKAVKISSLIRKLQKSKDADLWRRHAKLRDFVRLPAIHYHAGKKNDSDQSKAVGKSNQEKRAYHFWWHNAKKLAYVWFGLLFVLFMIHSIKMAVEKGLPDLVQYWGQKMDAARNVFVVSGKNNPPQKTDHIRKNKHLQTLLTDDTKSVSVRPMILDPEALANRYKQAKKLLHQKQKNKALLLINETLQQQIPMNEQNRFQILQDIAFAFELKEDPLPIDRILVEQNPALYKGCLVDWQGVLQQVIGRNGSSWLRLKMTGKGAGDDVSGDAIFVAHWPGIVGSSRIGSTWRIVGHIQLNAQKSGNIAFLRNKKFYVRVDSE